MRSAKEAWSLYVQARQIFYTFYDIATGSYPLFMNYRRYVQDLMESFQG
jgi:hypothetical protein